MSAAAPVAVRGMVGDLTLDEVRRLRAESQSTLSIAARAMVSAKRIRQVLRALGLAYPRGGARPNSGPKPRRRCAPCGGRW